MTTQTLTASNPRRLMRKPEARAVLGDSNTQLHEKIKRGLVVRPVKIGGRAVAFPSDEIDALVSARVAGLSDDGMRALVERLHERRQAELAQLGLA